MARSHYRGTVYGNTPTGAKPLPGAAIRLFHPDTGQPWALPVYPDPVNGTPYALPIYTSVDGELELWADDPARVACHVSHRAYHGVGEVIEIRPDPETQATDEDVEESVEDHEAKTNPHDQYLTQGEGDFLYKPVDWEPDLTDYYTKGEADDEFLDQDEGDLRYEQLSRKGMPLGYVPLDPAGLIPNAYLPPLAISDTFVVISEAEMLALPAQKGDIAVRLDTTENYVLAQDPATVLANWTKLAASTTAGNTTVLRREEFTPTAGTNTVALAAPPTVIQALSRNGVGQSQPAGHFSVSGTVVTFTDPFVAGERVAVVYEIGSSIPAPVNGYTKEESDLRYEPIDTMYTKAESDAKYLTQALGDARYSLIHTHPYLPLTGGDLTGPLTIQTKPVNVSPDSGNALVWRANGFYSSGSGGNVTVVNREEFFPAAAATTVTLAQAPSELLSVSRNGVDQFAGAGDYSLAGAVITFSDAFVAGERVSVLSEVGTSVPVDAYTTAQSEARYVNVTGDQMTGNLGVAGTVTLNDRLSIWDTAVTRRWDWAPASGDLTLWQDGPGAFRMRVAANGTVSLTPDTGVPALVAMGHVGVGVTPSGSHANARMVEARAVGSPVSARVGQHAAGTYAAFTINAYHDGANWQRDSTGTGWGILQMANIDGGIEFASGPSGVAPAGIPLVRWNITRRGMGLPNCRGDADGVGADARWSIDASQAVADDTVTIGHTGVFHPFNTGSFSGMFIVNNISSGGIGMFLQGGGALYQVGGSTEFSVNTPGTANKTNIYFDAGYNIAIQNLTTATAGYRVFAIRTRTSA